jgi:hypothetical protein
MSVTSSSGTARLTACILVAIGGQAGAADFPVPDTGDPMANGASLVAAVNAAMHTPEEDDRVLLDPGVHYVLANPDATYPDNGLPLIDSGITIHGGYNPKGELTTIERKAGAAPFRIMQIQPRIQYVKNPNCNGPVPLDLQPTVRLEYLKISNGDIGDVGTGALNHGGGIYNQDGRLVLYRSDVNGNRADFGAGIANDSYTLKYQIVCFGALESDWTFAGTASVQESSVRGNVSVISGGGISNGTAMSVDHSTISGNEGDERGGGILNAGSLDVAESTVSGNSTVGPLSARPGDAGAGIHNSGTRLTVSFSTVAFNHGTGIANESRTVAILSNTILAGNAALYDDGAGLLPFDCFGTIRSLGYNLIGVADPRSTCVVTPARNDQVGFDRAAPIDAKLAALAANGGFTQTHALLDGSPAINHANSASSVCPMDDQRGVTRRRIPGDACDIGAFEKVVPGSCGLDCSLWRLISVCGHYPFTCEKLMVPKIDKLPQVPDCLLDGPGCLVPPPVDFQ